ncbi:gastrula zinc finger protein XlCGF8.2DB-like isoform X1 [Ctenopharyngodon idella]|uniref:gastrula zinc finger protein XlCGF8.2DB-like isoform X1 n=1 Tax=Ctenopharyngodon idella TaxID=7959 RepID=UPI0022319ADF|nr:gastrula zinc finger protein XlCGF8.2DB-like isoform X1 [Ctenopharyngodon idella]
MHEKVVNGLKNVLLIGNTINIADFQLMAWRPDCINMKPSENFLGVLRSKSTKEEYIETLVLSKIEGSAVLFCQRLKYRVKSIQVPDGSPSDIKTEAEPSISHFSNGKKTSGKKFSCKLCGMEYRQSISLVRHMRIHTGEAPYTCELCGRGFRRKDWLDLHSSVHTGNKRKSVKRFSCDQCEKKFTGSTALQSHLYKHKGERPFACVYCDKTFYSQTNLKRHQVDSHSDSKQFCCPMCGIGFSRLFSLQKHTRIHTRERPFSCPDCGKTFGYKYSMNIHRKRCKS